MPPTGAPWTAVIAAAAALLGVLLGQFLQTRREDRSFQRQSEEQRRRDAEQREDQRRRDSDLWRREDARRFVEFRRTVYVEYLAAANKAYRAVFLSRLFRYPDKKPATVMEEIGFDRELRDVLQSLTGGISLIAPDSVVMSVKQLTAELVRHVDREDAPLYADENRGKGINDFLRVAEEQMRLDLMGRL